MKKYTYARVFYTVFTILAIVACAVALTALYIFNTDLVDIDGVYQTALLKNNGFTTAFVAFCCFSVAVLAVSFLLYRKAEAPGTEKTPKNLLLFLNAACGLFILATAVMQFILDTENTPYRIPSLRYIMTVLAIPGALYFLWRALAGKCPKGLRMFFGIALAAWLCCSALCLHFFMNDFLTSPTRVLSMLSCCFLILFILTDVRLDTASLYVPAGLVAAFFAIPEGASKLVLSFTHQAGFSPNISAFFALCRLGLGVYALISVISYLYKAKDAAPAPAGGDEASVSFKNGAAPEETNAPARADEEGTDKIPEDARKDGENQPRKEEDETSLDAAETPLTEQPKEENEE